MEILNLICWVFTMLKSMVQVYELLKDKASQLSGEVQQMLDILCRTDTSESKACSQNELMEHAEFTKLISNEFTALPHSVWQSTSWISWQCVMLCFYPSIDNHVVHSSDDLINMQFYLG